MTAHGFRQTEPKPWPSGYGEPVAVFAREPEVLEASYGLRFFEGEDNLDVYKAAAVQLPSGRVVGLIRHLGNPLTGTELQTDSGDNFLEAIREFLDAFELSEDDLVWIHEGVQTDDLRLETRASTSTSKAIETIWRWPHPWHSFSPTPTGRLRILVLSANSTWKPVDLERETRWIRQEVRMVDDRDVLDFQHLSDVSVHGLIQAMQEESTTIVHFAGHGGIEGIYLRDELGNPRLVSSEALASAFELFQDKVQCVVLNACWSEPQAKAIHRYIPYVVGTPATILDTSALAFAAGFYRAIGAGGNIELAYKVGKIQVELEGSGDENVPVLL